MTRHSSLFVRILFAIVMATLIAGENSVRPLASSTQRAFDERCNVSERACNMVLTAHIREKAEPVSVSHSLIYGLDRIKVRDNQKAVQTVE